ncbi:hypothetical protein AB0J52_21700 [Spirillospora sp. NPDC049652]
MREMRKRRWAAACATGAAFVGVGALSAPALAGTQLVTWTAGGGTTLSGQGIVYVQNATIGSVIVCDTSSLTGTMRNGTGLSGIGIGTVTGMTFSNSASPGYCRGPLGLSISFGMSMLPYSFDADGYSSGTATGTISRMQFTMDYGGGCVATVGGSTTWSYTNTAGKLKFTGGNLHTTSVTASCDPDIITTGASIKLSGTLPLSPVLSLTSP